MKLQSEHLHVQSLDWKSAYSESIPPELVHYDTVDYEKVASESQATKLSEILAGPSDVASVIQTSLSSNISANKRAVIDRLITLWAEGGINE